MLSESSYVQAGMTTLMDIQNYELALGLKF
jgi:hypothetical protein